MFSVLKATLYSAATSASVPWRTNGGAGCEPLGIAIRPMSSSANRLRLRLAFAWTHTATREVRQGPGKSSHHDSDQQNQRDDREQYAGGTEQAALDRAEQAGFELGIHCAWRARQGVAAAERAREDKVSKSSRLVFAVSSNDCSRSPCSRSPRCRAAPNRPAATSTPGDTICWPTECVAPPRAARLTWWPS